MSTNVVYSGTGSYFLLTLIRYNCMDQPLSCHNLKIVSPPIHDGCVNMKISSIPQVLLALTQLTHCSSEVTSRIMCPIISIVHFINFFSFFLFIFQPPSSSHNVSWKKPEILPRDLFVRSYRNKWKHNGKYFRENCCKLHRISIMVSEDERERAFYDI